ncbi:MAG: helix-turn-helix transcriptional regulator [Clostridia bacterium]|nr:helix-turn-helix transcriptional regulator [Clostridia bacterium]
MEFSQKLQELRRQKGLTQEQLAAALFVSRTAVSKWESGRGYPAIDSLKTLAKFFEISVDELLSSEQLLTLAEHDSRDNKKHLCDFVFGLLDISALMLFFVPFFAQKSAGVIREVSLLSLTEAAPYIKAAYLCIVSIIVLFGILTLALQNSEQLFWNKNKTKISLILNMVAALLFVIGLQPYAAVLLLVFLLIKVLLIIKKR